MPSALLSFRGDADIERALRALPEEIRDKAIPYALRRAGARVIRSARAKCPVDKTADPAGTLKRSLGAQLRGRRSKRYLALGARRGYARTVTRPVIVHGELKGAAIAKADPANYAHLVEFGHRVVVPKKNTSIREGSAILATGRSFVAARPFLRPAFADSREAVKQEFIQALANYQVRFFTRRNRKTTPVR